MYFPNDILKDLIYFHDRINNLFEERLKSIYSITEISEGTGWTPAVDIYETEGSLYVTAELPGVDIKDVRIEAADNELVLKGSRPFPKKGLSKEDYHRLEGSYGSFERRFPLPTAVDRDRIKAVLKDGVLKVTIPKAADHRITAIDIEGQEI